MERRELPGNDASWYRAFLVEQDGSVLRSEPSADLESTPHIQDHGFASAEPDVIEGNGGPAPANDLVSTTTDDREAVGMQLEAGAGGGAAEVASRADDPTVAELPAPHDEENDSRSASPTGPALISAVPEVASDEPDPVETTSEMVGQLWTGRTTAGPLDGWEPEKMDRKITSQRHFRWTTVVGVLLVGGLIAAGLLILPSIARNRAATHRDMFTTVLGDLRGELPETQTSLAIATDPGSDRASLEQLTTQLTALAAKISALDQAAQADLPDVPPFTSSAPIDELEPIRQRLEPLGTVATTIQRRISMLAQYRMLMADFLVLPELPVTADSATQAELRVVLAAAQAESASVLGELPSDVSLDDHHASARAVNERFGTWQVDYLEALRTEDSTTARALLAELGDALAELDNELITPLAQIRRQTDTDIIELASSIDEVALLARSGGDGP